MNMNSIPRLSVTDNDFFDSESLNRDLEFKFDEEEDENHEGNIFTANEKGFSEWLEKREFSDVILITPKNREYYCHKIILAYCSEYFHDLFINQGSITNENNANNLNQQTIKASSKNFDLDSALESSDSEESQPSSTNSNVKDTISSIDIYNNSNNNSLPILPTLALQSATQSIAKSADEISVPLTPTGTTSSNLSQTTDSIEKKRKPKSNSFIKSPRTDSKELNVENRSVSPKKRSPRKELKESKDGTGIKEKEKEKSKEKRDKDKKEKRDKRDKEAKTKIK
eukprot:TRINITY_DN4575_c0_g1_i1.p2 TRINITY_DN4575_c0_g1~~TRINITY_DN4575_c0_g1_i1.p2  ORF type:complete len:283 (+),score=41.97 TRINITY_DN4575_c0_g1_i1:1-849(+)